MLEVLKDFMLQARMSESKTFRGGNFTKLNFLQSTDNAIEFCDASHKFFG